MELVHTNPLVWDDFKFYSKSRKVIIMKNLKNKSTISNRCMTNIILLFFTYKPYITLRTIAKYAYENKYVNKNS